MQRLNFDLSRLPLWVHLYNVPLELYSREVLSYIAIALGVPLTMDSITASKTRLEYAKVCIEIRAKEDLPETVDVILANGQTSTICVEVPWFPYRCKKCSSFGHSDKECLNKTNSAPSQLKIWRKKTPLNDNADLKTGILEPLKHSLPESSPSKENAISNENDPITEPESSTTQKDQHVNVKSSKSHLNISNEASNSLSQSIPHGEDLVNDNTTHAHESAPIPNETPTNPKRGRGRPLKIKAKYALRGSSNRFEILTTVEENSSLNELPVKKTRPAAAGVAKLINDLK
ncbi:uncharacterized protein LOC120128501 [Hibiscus syriacus]|uniref:uncharacterized protein LOC120128501 n=1 Tax=Hibiscus syriacus TaxID=106335 RepID=UPI001921F765|nr:uncharacterized protein LOC120128501 [Hibiscus syriacus]